MCFKETPRRKDRTEARDRLARKEKATPTEAAKRPEGNGEPDRHDLERATERLTSVVGR